jgi:hypothetical protein
MYLDTVAVYSTAWETVPVGKQCVDQGDTTLTHLYVGDGTNTIPNRINTANTADQAVIFGTGSVTDTNGGGGTCN